MRYLSVCSGIEAASVAWHPLGWEPAAFCEIEAFPSAVLKERYPHVPNYGDFTRLSEPDHPIRSAGIDILVGGTPCQAFSVAGLRKGLADPRGGLTLEFVRLAQALRPRWIVWENVPGVLSQDGGRAFGAFLGALGDLGYGWAYRVLDAQYVRVDGYPRAVPQRRRRVFVVACAGGQSGRAAAVLFEPEGVRRDSAPRRETRQDAAASAAERSTFWNGADVAESLTCTSDDQRMPDKGRMQMVVQPLAFAQNSRDEVRLLNGDGSLAGALSAENGSKQTTYVAQPSVPYDLFQITAPINRQNRDERSPCHTLARDNAAHAAVVQPLAFDTYNHTVSDVCQTIKSPNGGTNESIGTVVQPLAFDARQTDVCVYGDKTGPLHTDPGTIGVCVTGDRTHALRAEGADAGEDGTKRGTRIVPSAMSVRRLTPTECERLQGFPDGWTAIPWKGKPASECPDGPRYRALGNSMAVNVMRWIGRRIELVDAL